MSRRPQAETKTCRICHTSKPLSEFPPKKDSRDGHRHECHECDRTARKKRWHDTHGGKQEETKTVKPYEGEKLTQEESADTRTIDSWSLRVQTVEDALAKAEVDTDVWAVERFVVNSWEVAMKQEDGSAKTVPLWQVKLWLSRRIKKRDSLACDLIVARMDRHSPRYPKLKFPKLAEPHLLEISINDAHMAKLCWRRESGDDFDLKIAESLYSDAIRKLAAKASAFEIERILLPVGNDFFHVDGPGNMTTNGTPQDTDGRYVKMFETGQMCVVNAIDFLQQIAPVDVVWVGGNHDRQSSWMLVHTIKAWFRQCDRVRVDDEPTPRKYYEYGSVLLGLCHGDEERHIALPNIMAAERPEAWARTRHREWHLGHQHRRREVSHVGTDSVEGVIVRVLPSLSGRDAWHARRGYIGIRAADAFLYNKVTGPSGQFIVNIDGDRKVA